MRRAIKSASAASAGFLFSVGVIAEDLDQKEKFKYVPSVDIVGGIFMNDHLREGTSGREHQIKMSKAVLTLDLSKDNWISRIEVVALGDEMKYVPGDRAYLDIYRNLGTDIYYYGDYPVREAWVGQSHSWGYWKAGRMVTLMGEPVTSDRFATAGEAPNAVIMNTGLLNGIQIGFESPDGFLRAEGAIMGGRDRPCLGVNCYLNGALDVNEKGNNTPILEGKMTFNGKEGLKMYAGYHYTKIGSAVGSLESGKHNDSRVTMGVNLDFIDHDMFKLDFSGEYNRFTVGLTTDGAQGEATTIESRDIDQEGFYGIVNARLPEYGVTLRYTHEMMDRMDAAAWKEIAGFDEDHPVVDEKESRNIVTLIKDFESGFSVRAFYRQDDVPFLTIGDKELEDRAGIVFSYNAKF